MEKNLKKIFVLLVGVMGMLILFLTPPISVPDENAHFLNAYAYSRGDFIADKDESGTVVGKYYPKYVLDFLNRYISAYNGDLKKKNNFRNYSLENWYEVSADDKTELFYASDLLTITPIAYVASSSSMFVYRIFAKIISNSYINGDNLLLAGRMGNLLFYLIVSYLTISITPVMKKTMMLLLSMPMSIFLGASLSYDAVLIPITFLFLAEFFKLMFNDANVTKKDIVIISICIIFMASIKMLYAPFVLLLFLIPYKKFASKKQYIISITSVAVSGLIGVVLPKIITYFSVVGTNIVENENITIQREYIMQHLYKIPYIIVHSLISNRNFYITSFVGKLGTLDTNLPIIYIIFFILLLIVVSLFECMKIRNFGYKQKLFTIAVLSIVIVGMFMIMYITWTPLVCEPKGDVVSGLQGRYFIPIYMVAMMILFNNFASKISNKNINLIEIGIERICTFLIIFNPIYTVVTLLLRYWC